MNQAKELRTMADILTAKIKEEFKPNYIDPRKYKEAVVNHKSYISRLERTKKVLLALAEIHKAGEVPAILKRFNSITHVFDLMGSAVGSMGKGRHSYLVDTNKPMVKTAEAQALWALL